MSNSCRNYAVLFTFGVILAMIAITLQAAFPSFRTMGFVLSAGCVSSLSTTIGLIGLVVKPNC